MRIKYLGALALLFCVCSTAWGKIYDIQLMPQNEQNATSWGIFDLGELDIVGYAKRNKNFTFYADLDMDFDLPELASNELIQSASLNLDVLGTSGDKGRGIANLYHQGDNLVSNLSGGLRGWESFDVSRYLQDDQKANKDQASFSLKHIDPLNTYRRSAFSGLYLRSADSSSAPYLRVVTNVVFEPVSASLFLLGGGALGIRGWRKRKQASASAGR